MEVNSDRETPAEVLIAQEFRLVNAGGERRARLYIDEHESARLSMYDGHSETERLSVGFDDDNSPALQLYDPEGVLRVILHLDRDQDPGLALYDSREDKARIALIAMENGASHLWFSDPSGRQYMRMFTGDEDDGMGLVLHEQGHRRVVLTMDEGAGSLFFCDNSHDGDDTTRLGFKTTESGEAQVLLGSIAGQVGITVILDRNGIPNIELSNPGASTSVVVSLPETGVPHVMLRNASGEQSWAAGKPNIDA